MTGSTLKSARLFIFAGVLSSCNPTTHDTFVCGAGEQTFRYSSSENVFEIIQGTDSITKLNFVAFKSGSMNSYSAVDSTIETNIYYISNFFYIDTGPGRSRKFENINCIPVIDIDSTSQIYCRNDGLRKNVEISWSKKYGVQAFVEKYDSGEITEYRLAGKVGVGRLCKSELR